MADNFNPLIDRSEIRRMIAEELSDVMKNYLDKNVDEEQYDDFYIAKVMNNNDPDKEGKVQVRIYRRHSQNIKDNDLPWAIPDFNFIGSKVGSFIVPPVNTLITVYFDVGDVYLPHYIAKAYDATNLPTQKDKDYPNNMVFFETDSGSYFTININTNLTTLHHNSGSEITMDSSGMVTIKATSVNIPHTGNAAVIPDTTGGPFCALIVDPITGAPHQGTMVTNTPGVIP